MFHRVAEFGHGDKLDHITDFGEGDLIALDEIDADRSVGGDQGFAFIGDAAFTGGPASELRFSPAGENRYLMEGDMDHDGVADFAFLLDSASEPVKTDFTL